MDKGYLVNRRSGAFRVLYTSAHLHDAIKGLFSSPAPGERRVALVAYVGAAAEAFLPDVDNLQVICALEPGATSAEALSRFRARGAKVSQSPRLHMKVYWSSRRGAVICSANASQRALAHGGLKEVGVALPVGAVDIDRLIRYANPHPISNADLARLARLSDKLVAARGRQQSTEGVEQAIALDEWLSTSGSKVFKVGAYSREANVSKTAKAVARKSHAVSDPYSFISAERRGQLRAGDWVLMFDAASGRGAEWLYVDFVVKLDRSELRGIRKTDPYDAVQLRSRRYYALPPFRLDKLARAALASAVREYGGKKLEASAELPPAFRNALRIHLRKADR
jgi:hypothetical protein